MSELRKVGGGKPAKAKEPKPVPPIVPGQEVFSPEQFRMLLGGISRSYYHELRAKGAFKFSRLGKGKQVVHTLAQYKDYVAYLNGEGVVGKSDIADWKREKQAAAGR
jgi:hypothetical protein